MVTMSDVAKAAKVSKNTVSLALAQSPRISLTTRHRIERIATALGYQKNPTVAHLMAQLRSNRTSRLKAILALLNANVDRQAFKCHPTIPTYIEGCRRRAAELGYSLDEFWLHDPDLNSERLSRIFRSRNIRGGIIVGMMNENQLPTHFSTLWNRFPFIVTGVRTRNPTLSFCCTDHHALSLKAFEQALEMGYQRPALVLDHVIDKLVEGRFTSGVFIAQQEIPPARRTHPFYLVNEANANPALFQRWLKKEKPDAILTLYHNVKKWLRDLDYRVPEDMGLVQLEWRKDHPEWAGMNQHNDIVGETAVEMIISMIHSGAVGVPPFPQATLIGCSWIEGRTLIPRKKIFAPFEVYKSAKLRFDDHINV